MIRHGEVERQFQLEEDFHHEDGVDVEVLVQPGRRAEQMQVLVLEVVPQDGANGLDDFFPSHRPAPRRTPPPGAG